MTQESDWFWLGLQCGWLGGWLLGMACFLMNRGGNRG